MLVAVVLVLCIQIKYAVSDFNVPTLFIWLATVTREYKVNNHEVVSGFPHQSRETPIAFPSVFVLPLLTRALKYSHAHKLN